MKFRYHLFLFFSAIFLFSAFNLAAAADPNLQIEPAATPPPLCRWGVYTNPRYNDSQSFCYSRAGKPIEYIDSYLVDRYGGVPATGRKPEYCYLEQVSLMPVNLGSRGETFCPPLEAMVKFSVSANKIIDKGKFTIQWQAPSAQSCVLSGKAPEVGNFSQDFDGTESYIKGGKTYDFVKRGIYSFQFNCKGYSDNSKSTAQRTITRTATVFVGDIPPAPTVELKIEPAVIKKGESATLSWNSENALSLSINQGIGVATKQGSIKISPKLTTRYTITGSGEFAELGLARKSVTLRVITPEIQPEAPPIEVPPDVAPPPLKEPEKPQIDLKVNGQDGPVTMAPGSFTLSWNSDKYCLAYGSWIGVKTKAGDEKRTETKPGTYTYKLYCPTIGSDEVVVKVTGVGGASIPLPVAEASASLDGKNFSKSIRVTRGEKVNLWLGAAYDIDGDKKVSRDETGRWTGLISEGGQCLWNTDLNQGDPTFDGAVANPENPKSCTIVLRDLVFYDQPGVYRYGALRLMQNNEKLSTIAYINVAVQEPPPPDGPPVIDLRINNLDGPNVILGAPVEYLLSWNTRNADSCTASGAWSGDKFLSGSQKFVSSEKKEFTYTLNCAGKLGTGRKSLNLKVTELPVCDFSALPLTLSQSVFDRQSVLSWKCQFANTCEISPAVGKVSTFGSARVSPKTTTTYTLSCQNLEGSSSFDQAVEVAR
ncbi:MAG: hypothetical protein HYY86_01710 [Candidatus Harrisonbacteria bacterium]|nr:hypothetical protein [Candidatus Harrisonbacteria bacterium]